VIPYFNSELFELPILGRPVAWFGILVATGVLIGDHIIVAQGEKRGLAATDTRYLNARVVIFGFIIAHIASVLFYFPERIKENPLVLLNFWAGLSSFGGFFGAAIAYLYLTKKEKIPRLPYADAVALGLAPAWIFGRTGCFTAHDHPGRHTDFFLAVRYPDGPRHDLGLYEMLFTVVLTAILWAYARKPRREGHIIGLAAALYAPVRFGLDFVRAVDVARPDERYAGLTPAQWACMGCLAIGLRLLSRKTPMLEFTGPPAKAIVGPKGEPKPSKA
jgi:phosphatidylglycerol:prolipoprotein diacylglycerol transferase